MYDFSNLSVSEIQRRLWETFRNKFFHIPTQEIFWSGPNNQTLDTLNQILTAKVGIFAGLKAQRSLDGLHSSVGEADYEQALGDIYVTLSLLMSINGWVLTDTHFRESAVHGVSMNTIIDENSGMGYRLSYIVNLASDMGLKSEDAFRKAASKWVELNHVEDEVDEIG